MEPKARYTVFYELEHFNVFGEWTPAGRFYVCIKQSTPALQAQYDNALVQANASALDLSKQGKRVRITRHETVNHTAVIWDLPYPGRY